MRPTRRLDGVGILKQGPGEANYTYSAGAPVELEWLTVMLEADTATAAEAQVADRLPEGAEVVDVEAIDSSDRRRRPSCKPLKAWARTRKSARSWSWGTC
jgi:hypothetical protein